MNDNLLIPYAVLRRIHEKRQDILSAYVPFIEYSIYEIDKDQIEVSEIQAFILEQLNLSIPIHTIISILKKLKKNDLIEPLRSYEFIQIKNITSTTIVEYQEEFDSCERQRNEFINGFIDYIQINQSERPKILKSVVDYIYDSIDFINLRSSFSSDYLEYNPFYDHITDYINFIQQNNESQYTIFKDIYYGTILSKITDISEIQELERKINKLTIILDSNILFRLLGLQNEFFNSSSLELLNLLKNSGFELRVLTNTIDEMRRVLNHRYKWIFNKKIPEYIPPEEAKYIDGIIGAIYRRKLTIVDIETLIRDLELEIEKLDISVDRQDFLKEIKVDKKELENYSKSKLIKFVKSQKLDEYDIDVNIDEIIEEENIPQHTHDSVYKKCELDLRIIEYIKQQRKKKAYSFSDANFIFLTSDKKFANFNYDELEPQKINEVFLEESLTNILWLKNPEKSDDIPLGMTLSLYKSSKFIDFKIFVKFNEFLKNIKDNRPEEIELIGDIFNNQIVISRLKTIEEQGYNEELTEAEFENILKLATEKNSKKFDLLHTQLDELIENRNDDQLKIRLLEEQRTELNNKSNLNESRLFNKSFEDLKFRYNIVPIILIIGIILYNKQDCYDAFPYILQNYASLDLLYLLNQSVYELIIVYLISFLLVSQKFYDDLLKKKIREEIGIGTLIVEIFLIAIKSIIPLLTIGIIPILKAILKLKS